MICSGGFLCAAGARLRAAMARRAVHGALAALLLAGCSSIAPTGLKVFPDSTSQPAPDLTRVPKDLVSVKDDKRKMDFMVPRGWKQAEPDPFVLSAFSHKDGILAFEKGGKGRFYIWCYEYQNAFGLKAVEYYVRDISPLFEPVRAVNVKAERGGDNPFFRIYRGTRIAKGEPEHFPIFAVYRMGGVVSSSCDYMLLGVAANESAFDEIFYDVYAVSQSMRNQ